MSNIFKSTITGTKQERPPVWFMRQAGRALPAYQALKQNHTFHELMGDPKLAAEVTLLPIHHLGVDAAILFSDILVIPEALGMKLTFTEKGPVFDNPLHTLSNPLANLKPDSSKLDHIYEAIKQIIATRPNNTPLIGFCGGPLTTMCYMVQGISKNHMFPDTIKMLYKDRATTEKLIDIITELSIEYAVTQVKNGIDAFQLFETHAGLIPEDVYFDLMMPAVRKITKAIRQTGTPVTFFPKDIGTGISRITPDDTDFLGIGWQMPLTTARKMVDKKIGLQGNIDPRLLLADQKSIEKELNKLIPFHQEEGLWIFNLGHGVLPDTPVENLKFVADWVKQTKW